MNRGILEDARRDALVAQPALRLLAPATVARRCRIRSANPAGAYHKNPAMTTRTQRLSRLCEVRRRTRLETRRDWRYTRAMSPEGSVCPGAFAIRSQWFWAEGGRLMSREISILAAVALLFGFAARVRRAGNRRPPGQARAREIHDLSGGEARRGPRHGLPQLRHPGLLRRQRGQRQGIRVGARPRRRVPRTARRPARARREAGRHARGVQGRRGRPRPPKEPAASGSRIGYQLRWSDEQGEHTAQRRILAD